MQVFDDYPGAYLHALDLENWLPCHNLRLQSFLMSPDFMALIDKGMAAVHKSLRDAPLELLENGPFPGGAMTPRTGHMLIPGSLIRSNKKVGIGMENTRWFSDQLEKTVLHQSYVEVAFERIRRQIAPDASSRLCCLWVAEDSDDGRKVVQEMFMHNSNLRIMNVRISQYFRVTRADTAWFDQCMAQSQIDESSIQNYWKGIALRPSRPKWEYLVEGAIEFNSAEVAIIYEEAKALPSWPVGL